MFSHSFLLVQLGGWAELKGRGRGRLASYFFIWVLWRGGRGQRGGRGDGEKWGVASKPFCLLGVQAGSRRGISNKGVASGRKWAQGGVA